MISFGMKLASALVFATLAASLGLSGTLAVQTGAESVVFYSARPTGSLQTEDAAVPAVRRYEVREDADSGRLVRVSRRRSGGILGNPLAGQVVQGLPLRTYGTAGKVDVDALVEEAGERHRVDPELIHAVIRQESNYDLFAVSRKGACGLMQLMPRTADRFGVKNIFDPAENVEGGARYLRHLLDRYEGDSALALAAYNAGEAAVERYGGVPPYRETQDYVDRVSRGYESAGGSTVVSFSDGAEPREDPRIVTRVGPAGLITFEMKRE